MTDIEHDRMRDLVDILNKASKAYYMDASEIMSNYEYDALYDELKTLEDTTGVVLSDSPTIHVGYEVVSALPKERHQSPMLSLDKTKDINDLISFVGDQKTLISWKMDGLTIVLTYRDGELYKAVTRGNGEVGEVITNNAKVFSNVPLKISYKGELIVRGEAIIDYKDFDRINNETSDTDAKYKNPRNLCSGSVRQLDSRITAERNVQFYAFYLVKADNVDFHNSHAEEFEWLKSLGFTVVEYHKTDKDTIADEVKWFSDHISGNAFPSDGLVLLYDDIAYGDSLGRTAKFPRNSFAFKWADETEETVLRKIEWQPSRTGLINPVAVFDPVELEGTTVTRASVHNISIMKSMKLGIEDKIMVYKANMIVPQIADNLTKSDTCTPPAVCPVCGHKTEVCEENGTKTLYCTNPDCPAKNVKKFALMCSRDALNIDGLSEATLEKLIDRGLIKDYVDLFHLDQHHDEIVLIEGLGEKSYQNIIRNAENAIHTNSVRILYGLGIPGVGLANAKSLCKAFHNSMLAIINADTATLACIDGIGPVLADSIATYVQNPQHLDEMDRLLDEVIIDDSEEQSAFTDTLVFGKTFVITGVVTHFANRNELKAEIEHLGGKVTNSVTKNTDYLINNDVNSGSSKNKKAKELKIPIISENDFLKMCEV